ncbi:hypothetical protein SAMN05444000_11868 [Shimia gijangensis]|uniref:Uncharacterized protein n=1 Tax=Shimia gijangensis TaxID=1470563 RepID=A0A1M6PJX2_9RHOB|nr:hypothetical protein SAMN05444000_11868 [Shimia gijangensis]
MSKWAFNPTLQPCNLATLQPAVSGEFELVNTRPVKLSFMVHKDRALSKSSGAVQLEMISLGKAALLIEMVENGSMNGNCLTSVLMGPNRVIC